MTRTRVEGHYAGALPTTRATAIVEDLNVLNVIRVDELVAYISSEHPGEEPDVPKIDLSRSAINGLRVGNSILRVRLDTDFLTIGDGKRFPKKPHLFDKDIWERAGKKKQFDPAKGFLQCSLVQEIEVIRGDEARYQGQHHHDSGYRTSAPGGVAGERQLVRTDHDASRVGLPDRGLVERIGHQGQWHWRTVVFTTATFLWLLTILACSRDPQREFDRTEGLFLRGDLVRAQAAAEHALLDHSGRDPLWEWKFRLLDAQILAWRGMYPQILKVLEPEPPIAIGDIDLALERQIWAAIANIRLHNYDEAEKLIAQANQSCLDASRPPCGELFNVRGSMEVERGNYEQSRPFFSKSLSVARIRRQPFLEAWALLNLTHVALLEEHFEEAIDYANETYKVSSSIGAQRIMLSSQGNLGWATYKTGDSDKALTLFLDAQQRAANPRLVRGRNRLAHYQRKRLPRSRKISGRERLLPESFGFGASD